MLFQIDIGLIFSYVRYDNLGCNIVSPTVPLLNNMQGERKLTGPIVYKEYIRTSVISCITLMLYTTISVKRFLVA